MNPDNIFSNLNTESNTPPLSEGKLRDADVLSGRGKVDHGTLSHTTNRNGDAHLSFTTLRQQQKETSFFGSLYSKKSRYIANVRKVVTELVHCP